MLIRRERISGEERGRHSFTAVDRIVSFLGTVLQRVLRKFAKHQTRKLSTDVRMYGN